MSTLQSVRARVTRLAAQAISVIIVLALMQGAANAAGTADGTGPPAPAGLEVLQRQEDLGVRVTLSWNHIPGCFGYRVYRSRDIAGPYTCIGGVSAETMSDFPFFLDDQVNADEDYYYRVCALDAQWKEGPQGTPVAAKMPSRMRSSQVGKSITVSLADQRIYCYENGVVVNILRCSTGASGTPTGSYHIYTHRRYVYGGTYVCEYWMDWRPNYGMHSWPRYNDGYRDYEESLGVTPRSHGCIRLHPLEAYWPYEWAPDGTPLTVVADSIGRLPLQGASCSSGASKLSRTWYFAEGFIGGDFLEYLLLFNPGQTPVNALTTYYPEAGGPIEQNYFLPPGARQTIFVNQVPGLPGTGHATRIIADGGIVAQRAEYFDYGGRRGGHSSTGATAPSRHWYLAEGYTGGAFDTYLLLFNPNNKPATTTVTYLVEGGAPAVQQFELPPLYRGTTLVNAVPGLAGKSVAMKVESGRPVVAERTVYFSYGIPNGINGGDCTIGTSEASKTWYLAEGCTGHFFDEYILVLNTNPEPANVSAVFYPATGPCGYQFQVAPNSRGTVAVDSIPGLENADTAALITSDRDVTVERTMYDARDSRRGGHCSSGISEAANDWYFAEGYTGGTFDEYLLLLNAGTESANVRVVFHLESGADVQYTCGVPPQSRYTVHVDEVPGLEFTGSAAEVHSDRPVAAEQAHYFCVPR